MIITKKAEEEPLIEIKRPEKYQELKKLDSELAKLLNITDFLHELF